MGVKYNLTKFEQKTQQFRPGTDTTGGVGLARTPPPPPTLVTKKVTIFGHKKRDPQPAVLGSPLPVHVHGGGLDATWDT